MSTGMFGDDGEVDGPSPRSGYASQADVEALQSQIYGLRTSVATLAKAIKDLGEAILILNRK